MILNRQRSVPLSLASLDRFWERTRQCLRLPEDSLTICLVSETRIAGWNRTYRGKRGPTDVLSFPAQDGSAEPALARRNGPGNSARPRKTEEISFASREVEPGDYLGDIAIAPAVARRNARRAGRSLERELRILMLHGALHLLGYDHETDHGEMNRLERCLRRRLGLGQ